jgi:2-methylcitrate dehydratase PrpD
MPSASQTLAAYVSELKVDQIPADVVQAAQMHALDTLGCGLAAYALHEADFVHAAVEESPTPGGATAIGYPNSLSAGDAALINGVRCHALDYDDTHPDSVVHVSSAVTPAALAVGQEIGAPGPDVLAAIVAGNEVSIRIGAVAAGQFHARGFHPTGMVGIFGATAAAARVRQLDAPTTAHAFGIAGSMAGGLLEFLSDGAQTKPLHPGWAAKAAIAATRFAAHGATGPATVFEGSRGFYATYLHGNEADLNSTLEDLGARFETPHIAYKPYAACHYTHAPVDALATLMHENHFTASDVEHMVAFTESTGVGLVLEPAADKLRPRTAYDSKFSLPYCLARQLVRGSLGVESFTETEISDPDVLAFTAKVSYETRKYSPTPDSFGGGIRVVLHNGLIHELELRHQRGGHDNPMTEADIRRKFNANAALALNSDSAEQIDVLLTGLSTAADLTSLKLLASASRAHVVPRS